MPADTYEQLYDFESQIELAIVGAFEDLGLSAHKQRDTNALETPRVEVQFVNGAATDEYGRLPSGEFRPSHFIGTLGITLVTHRTKQHSTHGLWRAKVRRCLYDFRRTLDRRDRLPYLQIWRCQETGSTPSIQAEDGNDISTIAWDLKFAVRHDAWPSA